MIKRLTITLMSLVAMAVTAQAQDPAKATDDAYSMGVYYSARGFSVLPSIDGVDGTGSKISFLIPVTKGIDYVFLAGRDTYMRDLDIYVYDESNALLIKDRRSTSRAGVRFRSSYTGTVKVILHVARANGLGAWSVIVGRRGAVTTPNEVKPVNPNSGSPAIEDPK
ncbi:MAG: hypothetical protein KJO79_01725 [Verrucomicrobiae bacterium]|nr:hypothetical protein [Verrucomicrobiae bacterium]NNJ85867.1 hypothetical protein [Akkermansiaceae bacterium]